MSYFQPISEFPQERVEHPLQEICARESDYQESPHDIALVKSLLELYQELAQIYVSHYAWEEAQSLYEKMIACAEPLQVDSLAIGLYPIKGHEGLAGVLELVGSAEAALSQYRQALTAVETLSAQYPPDLTLASKRASLHHGLARSLAQGQNYAEALLTYERAIHLWEELDRQNPTTISFTRHIVEAYKDMIYLHEQLGDAEGGSSLHDKMLTTIETFFRRHGENPEALQVGEEILQGVVALYENMGRLSRAKEAYQRILSAQDELYRQCPSAENAQPLIKGYNALAWLHIRQRNLEEALLALEKEEELRKQWLSPSPDVAAVKDLAQVFWNKAQAYHRLGQSEKAYASYEEALQLMSAWEETALDYTFFLAHTCQQLALTCSHDGAYEKALEAYQRASLFGEKLLMHSPDNVEKVHFVATLYSGMGYCCTRLENYEEALRSYGRVVSLIKHLLRTRAVPAEVMAELGTALERIANLYEITGRPDRSLEQYEKAVETLEQFSTQYPTEPFVGYTLASTCRKVGDMYDLQGHFEQALMYYEKAAHMLSSLYKAWPTTRTFFQDYIESRRRLRQLHRALGQYETELALLQEDVELIRKKPSSSGQGNDDLSLLMQLYSDLSDLLRVLGRPDQACTAHEEFVALLEGQQGAGLGDFEREERLSLAFHALADAYAHAGRREEAQTAHQKACAHSESLYVRDKSNEQGIERLANSHVRIADFYAGQGELDQAQHHYNQEVGLRREIVALNPEKGEAIVGLISSLARAAAFQHQRSRIDDSMATYQEALSWAEHLQAKHPEDTFLVQEVHFLRTTLGFLSAERGRYEEAIGYYKEAIALWDRFLGKNPDSEEALERLSALYSTVGQAYAQIDKPEESLSAYWQAVSYAEKLYRTEDGSIAGFQRLILGLAELAKCYESQGNSEEALRAYTRLIHEFEAGGQAGEAVEGVLFREVFESYLRAAHLSNALGRHEEALAFLKEPTAMAEQLYAAYPNDPHVRAHLHSIYDRWIAVYQALGDTASAEQFIEKQRRLLG